MKSLPKKDQLQFVTAVCGYVFDGVDVSVSGPAAAAFLLAKPVLDKASKRAESGKKGVSKREANRKQTPSKTETNAKQTPSEGEKEVEVEEEVEVEVEVENEVLKKPLPGGRGTKSPDHTPAAAAVVADYLNRVNASASDLALEELRSFADTLGEAVCKRAMDIALDEKKATWSYIRAILRDKSARGVKSLADWDALEAVRPKGPPGPKNAPVPMPGQPGEADRRAREDMEQLRAMMQREREELP